MKDKIDQRNWHRELFIEPIRGVIYRNSVIAPVESPLDINRSTGKPFSFLYVFVSVHNISPKGALVESSTEFDPGSSLEFMAYDSYEGKWKPNNAHVVWTERNSEKGQFLAGLEFLPEMQDGDLKFLINSELLECIPQEDIFSILNCLSRKTVLAGERLISKGEIGDAMYLIQSGSCSVKTEKAGETIQVARMQKGDIVGEMAILTDEARSADVDAETDLVLWELSCNAFEKVSAKHLELRKFLTELLAYRFESTLVDDDRTIGKHIIKREIGKGGWSAVYHCTHKLLNRPAAVKMLKHGVALEPMFLKAFRKEAEIIASMSHRNIIHIYDIEEKYQTVFIVMELLEGQSLEKLLERAGPIEFPQAEDFLIQICSGLGYAHRKGIIHRDIKPSNIYIQPMDKIKILDFGLACAPGLENLKFKGTPSYAPPEQIQGVSVDARSDIYSMGIMAYEMVTGRHPYPEEDLASSMEIRCEQEILDPSKLVPGLPERLRKFIIKACRIDPEHRYQNIKEAQEGILSLSRNKSLVVDEPTDERRKMTALFLHYHNENEQDLTRILEEFTDKVKEVGVDIKAIEDMDI